MPSKGPKQSQAGRATSCWAYQIDSSPTNAFRPN